MPPRIGQELPAPRQPVETLADIGPIVKSTPRVISQTRAESASVSTLRWCAILTASTWWLAGQRPGWFALGWVALIPLFWSLHGLKWRSRWKQGYLTGILSYFVINWWIIPTIARSSPMIGLPHILGFLLGVCGVLICALVHGLGVAIVAAIWNPTALRRRFWPFALPVIAALVWAGFDVLRCQSQVAHSWGALAYTQWRDVPLLQIASIVGQHGLTAICVWFAASLALWTRGGGSAQWRLPLLVMAALHGWGLWHVMHTVNPRSLRVTIIQTAVPSFHESNEPVAESPLDQAIRLTQNAVRPGTSDVVVWPETIANVNRDESGGADGLDFWEIKELSQRVGAPILFGADSFTRSPGAKTILHNEAIMVNPDGTLQSNAKLHVVPFGERAAYSELLPFLKALAPNPEVTPSDRVTPLQLHGTTVGTLICFESCFQQPALQLGREGARVLFVLTNDEWTLGTTAPWEHAAMATVRAVENDATIVQSGNNGYSFVVDRNGRFVLNNRDRGFWGQGFALLPYGLAGSAQVTVPVR